MRTGGGIAGAEAVIRRQLGGTVKIDWAACLVSGQRDHTLDALVDTGVDQIHGAVDISLNAFERIVFCSRHNLGRSSVNHIINAIQCAIQTFAITNVADEKTNARVVLEALGHLPLLHFIAGEDDDFLWRILFQS